MEDGIEHRTSTQKTGIESNGEKEIKAGYTFQAESADDKSSQVEFELDGELVSESGHRDQLKRQYSTWSL